MNEVSREKRRIGTLVAHHGVAVWVLFDESGEKEMIRVARKSGHSVGDRVVVEGERLKRVERRNQLRRRSPGGGVHVVAANLDLLCVVVAPFPEPRQGLVDRAAVAARAAGIPCVLVVNKSDLDENQKVVKRFQEIFAGEIAVISTSAKREHGTDALRDTIAKHGSAILCGHSGVGKSSITNALLPEAQILEGVLNENTQRGRHTTTTATLHHLPSGGALVDTPGIREFGLVDVTCEELAENFVGFEEALAEGCKFRNCAHLSEPKCAVLAAVEDGEIPASRHERYRTLYHELRTQNDAKSRR